MKKMSQKKMPVTFCEEYMGLFYFFKHFYATGLHSFMGHIGSHQWWLELISDYKFVPLCSENFVFLLHALKQVTLFSKTSDTVICLTIISLALDFKSNFCFFCSVKVLKEPRSLYKLIQL